MKKILLFAASCALIVALDSCNNGNQTTKETSSVTLQPNDSLFAVSNGGYNFQIILPKDLMIMNTPRIDMNSATGELHIHLGDQFWIVASQEKTDMTAIKSAIQEDMLFTSRVVEETNNSILVERILPDGTTYDRSVNDIGGKPYIFKTSEEGEFSIESVNRMKYAISSVHETV